MPRGRRLGSFRFLEALQAGCIPVLVSNGWALPFDEVIEWGAAAVWADERLLLQVADVVRGAPAWRLLRLRQQTQLLWERYFSSIEKIVFTVLEVVRERLPRQAARDRLAWNRQPGGLLSLPHFSDSLGDYPFYGRSRVLRIDHAESTEDSFTAVVYCRLGQPPTPGSPLYRLVASVARSRHLARLLVVWSSERPAPARSRFPPLPRHVSLHVLPSATATAAAAAIATGRSANSATFVTSAKPSISHRFRPHPLLQTAAVLSLDEDALLTTDEVEFAFRVWRHFPDRIVGYPARSHYWDDAKASWGYTSKWTNDYSIVLTGAAFYHRYYNTLYTEWLSPLLHKTVEQSQNCEDILMNFLVSHATRRPPLKLTQRKQYKEAPTGGAARSPWNDPDHFIQRQTCLNTFAAVFGYMPLLRSNLRLDPVLFKDPVSNLRKRYRQIELVAS